MKMNLTSKPRKAVAVEMFYDGNTRSWCIFKIDKDSCQIGDATYVHSKREAEKEREQMEKEIGSRGKQTPCDTGACPYAAELASSCAYNCGVGVPEEPEKCAVCGAPAGCCDCEE
jgi:hypothetical protein